MDAAEGYLPQALSLSHRVPGSSLASRRAGRSPNRDAARYLLLRLLLDANGVAVRRRTDEPRLGCCDRALGAAGEDNPLGGTDESADGDGLHRMGLFQLNQSGISRIAAPVRWLRTQCWLIVKGNG
jgi:hypothetical protein